MFERVKRIISTSKQYVRLILLLHNCGVCLLQLVNIDTNN